VCNVKWEDSGQVAVFAKPHAEQPGRGGKVQTEQRRGRRKATLRDVAKESGVSVTAASLVISDGPGASRFPLPTRERIWKAARQLGYHPNLFARSLRQSRSQTLGVLLFDITDPYCTQILRGIENRLRSSGYFSVITDLQNNGRQFHPCIEMLMERQVEGIIAVANPVYLAPNLFTEFVYRQIPAVVIGRDLRGNPVSSIAVDDESGARQALQYLYQLGHTRIAFIKGPKALSDTERRWRGIKGFAHEVGLKLEPELIATLMGPNSTYAEAYRLAEELVSRDSQFTALLAFDDLTACAAIRALTKVGRAVPRDCSVIGFDDIPSGAFYNPPLTTVQQQLEVQGFLGAEVIEELIKAKFEARVVQPRHHTVEPRLIVRESTSSARRT